MTKPKKIGLTRATPIFKHKELVKKHDVQICSSNYTLYGDMSNRVMRVLSQFTPNIEIYSIDEAFLLLNGFTSYNLKDYAQKIRKKVMKWTGIPVSVGIGSTKTLSKLANHIAKKNPEYDGVFDLTSQSNTDELLSQITVINIWGVGSRYSKMLNKNAIRTAFDLKEAVASFTSRALEKLRKQKSLVSRVSVFIETNSFRTNRHQYNNSITIKLPVPTNYTPELTHYVLNGLKKIYKVGYCYKKAGIMLFDIISEKDVQFDLFIKNDDKKSVLMSTIDEINNRFGRNMIKTLASGFNHKWKMNQNNLSSRFTTRWDELLTINV